jgi:hypothetical protein
MIEDTIAQIESRIQSAGAVSPERRRELLQLLATLKAETVALARTHGEQAQSIAGFAQLSAHEATRAQRDPKLLKFSLEGFNSSVGEFEKSHPRLTQVVNAICNALANLGI